MYSNESLPEATARAPITLQSLMHLLHWKEGSVAISISCLGKGNTARLSNLLKVTQKFCSRTEEWSQKRQVSVQPGDHHPTYEQCVALGEALALHTCYHGLAAALMPTAEDATSRMPAVMRMLRLLWEGKQPRGASLPGDFICNYVDSIWILHGCLELNIAEPDPHPSGSLFARNYRGAFSLCFGAWAGGDLWPSFWTYVILM